MAYPGNVSPLPPGSFGRCFLVGGFDFDRAAEAGATVGVGHPDAPWGATDRFHHRGEGLDPLGTQLQ